MIQLLAKIIPLDLAATLSPGILAISLLLLGSKKDPKIRTLCFFLGSLIIGIGITLIGVFLGHMAPAEEKQTIISAIVDLVLGLFFVGFGIKVVLTKERKIRKTRGENGPSLLKIFLAGVVITATNTDADLLIFIAAKETVADPDITSLLKIILLIINLSFFVLPITLPFLFYLFFPKIAAKPLAKLNILAMKYSRFIVFVLFAGFGIYFVYRGIMFFIK